MNELEVDKQSLKTRAHNFEKQNNQSILKFDFKPLFFFAQCISYFLELLEQVMGTPPDMSPNTKDPGNGRFRQGQNL